MGEHKSFRELASDEPGTVYVDKMVGEIRFLVLRGPISLCAYIGVPSGHVLSGKYYDDIDVDCHGGLTFSGEGDGKVRPEGFYWFGWDYAHCGDKSFYDLDPRFLGCVGLRGIYDKEWTVEMVERDSERAISAFVELAKSPVEARP